MFSLKPISAYDSLCKCLHPISIHFWQREHESSNNKPLLAACCVCTSGLESLPVKERWTNARLSSSTEVQGWISSPGGSVILSAVVQLWYHFTRATLDLQMPSTSPLLKSCFINFYLLQLTICWISRKYRISITFTALIKRFWGWLMDFLSLF